MVRVKEREGGGEESFLPSPPSPPSFILWLSFHFSGGQTRPFFAPKPNENACYARYTQMWIEFWSHFLSDQEGGQS